MSQLIIAPNAMPALQLPADVLAKVQAQLKQAADNQSSSLPRLSFGGKMFNLNVGGSKVELQDRVLDVHIGVVRQHHDTALLVLATCKSSSGCESKFVRWQWITHQHTTFVIFVFDIVITKLVEHIVEVRVNRHDMHIKYTVLEFNF